MFTILMRYGPCACVVSLVLLSIAGCGSSATQGGPGAAGATHGQHSQPAHPSEETDPGITAELAKLSPEDRVLAEKQKRCPVTDALLGSMGVPVKVTVKGRTVFLCCEGCEEELKQNPDKFLAKLDRAQAK